MRAGTVPGSAVVTVTDSKYSWNHWDKALPVVEVESVTVTPASIPADGTSRADLSVKVVPYLQPVVWSILLPDLGCRIEAHEKRVRVRAGTGAGIITVRATAEGVPHAWAEATLTLTIP